VARARSGRQCRRSTYINGLDVAIHSADHKGFLLAVHARAAMPDHLLGPEKKDARCQSERGKERAREGSQSADGVYFYITYESQEHKKGAFPSWGSRRRTHD
jgi:hypothetical protein